MYFCKANRFRTQGQFGNRSCLYLKIDVANTGLIYQIEELGRALFLATFPEFAGKAETN